MKTRRLDKDFDGSDSRVVSLASDLAQDRLGLKKEVYDEMAKDVTMVIHVSLLSLVSSFRSNEELTDPSSPFYQNAWSVNFLLDVSSFEPGIIGAINLMKLALVPSTPGDFYFSSSVSSVFGWAGPGPVPEAVTESPSNAQNMGYARSKWVVEKLCETITESTPLLAGVLREFSSLDTCSPRGRLNFSLFPRLQELVRWSETRWKVAGTRARRSRSSSR